MQSLINAWLGLYAPGPRSQKHYRRGPCTDNGFIEKLWLPLKQEAVHLEDLIDGFNAYRVITD
ncbi:hypothetical protein [Roseibium sp. M-1]